MILLKKNCKIVKSIRHIHISLLEDLLLNIMMIIHVRFNDTNRLIISNIYHKNFNSLMNYHRDFNTFFTFDWNKD